MTAKAPLSTLPAMKQNRAAIILAAGKGTRMKSDLAKVLHRAHGRPLAAYPIERALQLRCDPVVVVVGHQAERVEMELRALFPKAPLRFAVQKEQLGTAHAVLAAKRALTGFDGRVLILSGDVPLLTAPTLRKLGKAGQKASVALLTMRPKDAAGYGRVVRGPGGEVERIVEKKDASAAELRIDECNAGIYDCDAKFLWRALAKVGAENAQKEYYLTDLVELAATAGSPAVAVEASEEEVAGVNDRVQLAWVGRVLRDRTNEAWMEAGVTLLDPATTWIEEGVRMEPDVVVEPNVRITGASRVGAGARIGFGCVVEDGVIGRDVTLKPYTVIEQAKVGDRAVVGPFARLRPDTVLEEEVRIGNFVEVKNTTMRQGAKANHLTYLGDATVGARTNVGAGTITCNYDGERKLRTELGSDVFIGSDTQLVAPVKVGDGAYVGAGTTLVEDVPAGALALSRPTQVVKEGWVAKKKRAPKVVGGQAAARKGRPSR